MSPICEIWVPGLPIAKGNHRGFMVGGHIRITEKNPEKLSPWVASVRMAVYTSWMSPPMDGPFHVETHFRFPRPQTHFRTGKYAGILRDDSPDWHQKKPDEDKLRRAVLDALTGIAYHDDSQVCSGVQTKTFGPEPGMYLLVGRPEELPTFPEPMNSIAIKGSPKPS